MIPCMMMVLGAVLHKGPGSVNVAPRLIVGVTAIRLIIIPLAGEFCKFCMTAFKAAMDAEQRTLAPQQGPACW